MTPDPEIWPNCLYHDDGKRCTRSALASRTLPEKGVWRPYCEEHGPIKGDLPWRWCKEESCFRWVFANDNRRCGKHGGADFLYGSHEGWEAAQVLAKAVEILVAADQEAKVAPYVDNGCFAVDDAGKRCGQKRLAREPICHAHQSKEHPLRHGYGRWNWCVLGTGPTCDRWAKASTHEFLGCRLHGGEDFFYGSAEEAEQAFLTAELMNKKLSLPVEEAPIADSGCFAVAEAGDGYCGKPRMEGRILCRAHEEAKAVHPLKHGCPRWGFCLASNGDSKQKHCDRWAAWPSAKMGSSLRCGKHGGADFYYGSPQEAECVHATQAWHGPHAETPKVAADYLRMPKSVDFFSPCCGNPLTVTAPLTTLSCECGVTLRVSITTSNDRDYRLTVEDVEPRFRAVPINSADFKLHEKLP